MKKIFKIIFIVLFLITLAGCNTDNAISNDIDLYDKIRKNTLIKNSYFLNSECKSYGVYSDKDQENEGSGEITIQKIIVVEGDNKLIQDTLIRDDYTDTFYIAEYNGKVYHVTNNTYIEDKDAFYETWAYLLIDRYLLDKDDIVNISKVDETHLKIEFNEKINDLVEVIIRSYFHESIDGPKISKLEVSNYTLSYSEDFLLDEINIEVNMYFDNDNNNSFKNTISVQVSDYDNVDFPLTEEDVTVKPERQYFSMGYFGEDGKLVTNDVVHPNQNIAIAYFTVQFENDEFDIENPYGHVQFLDCTNLSIDDYNNGKSPIEYLLKYDDYYYWVKLDTGDTFPYIYELDDEFFILQIDGNNYFFDVEDFQYIN